MHGLEVVHAKRIPTHGGSIRVYAARKGAHPVRPTVAAMLEEEERAGRWSDRLAEFRKRWWRQSWICTACCLPSASAGERVYGIGAPSRASTLINYTGLDDGILSCVLEVKGSLKTGKYMPGTVIPVMEESRLYEDQPGVRAAAFLAHRRRTDSQDPGERVPRQIHRAAAGSARGEPRERIGACRLTKRRIRAS